MAIILPADPIARAIIRFAQDDFPILEDPIGSNRSPEIDAMCKRWGVPLGSAWCALWTATVRQNAGGDVPPIKGDLHPAKAESWRIWALQTNRFSHQPVLGAAALYGSGGREPAHHIGCCVTVITPILMNFEGNTSVTGFSREGELTSSKPVDTERLIGYVHIHPITT